ncbi:MAG: hypothetical protein SH857_05920 [Chitinophagales bacterium]|nr:hypothetical protein [Chitinophagales bacterium]
MLFPLYRLTFAINETIPPNPCMLLLLLYEYIGKDVCVVRFGD